MFNNKNDTPELTDENIRDLAIELIVNKKDIGCLGLKRKVRLRVQEAVKQVAYEAALKEIITKGEMQTTALASIICDEVINYKPEDKKHVEKIEHWEASHTRLGGGSWVEDEPEKDEIIPAEVTLNIVNIQKYKNAFSSLQHPNADAFKSDLAIALRQLAEKRPDTYNVFKQVMEELIAALGL